MTGRGHARGSASAPRLLRVVIPESLAEPFQAALTVPATVLTTPTLRDEDVAPRLGDADVLISPRFTPEMAGAAKNLRLIQTIGAGTDEIDFQTVPAGATVCNVYGHETAIAEYVLMTMLALDRDLLGLDRRLRRGDWGDRSPQRELRRRTLGLVGLGAIGTEVARYAARLGMRAIAVTRSPDPDRAERLGLAFLGGLADLRRVLSDADFVVVAVPLNAATLGMIGERELGAMKPTAYLINVARGRIVDEGALYQALRGRRIAGAAIDVWYRYPARNECRSPSDQPFHELENVIMTPHIAGWTEGTVRHRWNAIGENLRRLACGEPLLNVVAPAKPAQA